MEEEEPVAGEIVEEVVVSGLPLYWDKLLTNINETDQERNVRMWSYPLLLSFNQVNEALPSKG